MRDDLVTVFDSYYADLASLCQLVGNDVEADQRPGVDLLRKLAMETARLIVSEQFFLLPALRESVPDGETVARGEAGRLAEIGSRMQALERVQVGDSGYRERLREFLRAVEELGEHRRTTIFPALRAALDDDALADLGSGVTPTAEPGATHSHPAEADLFDSTWPQPGFLNAMINVFADEVQTRHPGLVPVQA